MRHPVPAIAVLLVIALPLSASVAQALDCSEAGGMAAARSGLNTWKRWCQDCGGKPMTGPYCKPGPNWKGSTRTQPAGDAAAEQQRQQAEQQRQEEERRYYEEQERLRQAELEEQRRKDEEATRQRQQEFERSKEEALRSMKGIAAGEFGLKESTAGGDLGLKGDAAASGELGLKGGGDASVVDLRDKQQPLVVDPAVVKGEKRPGEPARELQRFMEAERAAELQRKQADENYRFIREHLLELTFTPPTKPAPFPTNPNQPLFNPLREPERWRAFEKAAQARIDAMLQQERTARVVRRLAEDPEFAKARARIQREENRRLFDESTRLYNETERKLKQLEGRSGVKTLQQSLNREASDPAYRQARQAILEEKAHRLEEAGYRARYESFEKVRREVDRFEKRYLREEGTP